MNTKQLTLNEFGVENMVELVNEELDWLEGANNVTLETLTNGVKLTMTWWEEESYGETLSNYDEVTEIFDDIEELAFTKAWGFEEIEIPETQCGTHGISGGYCAVITL